MIHPIIQQAVKTVEFMDATDKKAGFDPPRSVSMVVKASIYALNAGIVNQDWECVGEALVMLARLTKFDLGKLGDV